MKYLVIKYVLNVIVFFLILSFSSNYTTCKVCNVEKMRKYRNNTNYDYNSFVNIFIYIIINDAWSNCVKIGRAKNIKLRLMNYKTYSSFLQNLKYPCVTFFNIYSYGKDILQL